MNTTIRNIGLLAFGSLLLVGCSTPTNSTDTSATPISPTATTVVDNDSMMEGEMEESGTIAEVAADAGSFNTLLAAVEAAGLTSAFTGTDKLTVFAPTDAAFEKLPAGTVEALLADPEQLTAILTYHVVAGEVLAEDVVGLDSATTLQGSEVTITTDAEGVMINDARVIQTDIMASNGVIHVIDTVLIPE